MSHVFKSGSENMLFGLSGQSLANGQLHFYDRSTGEYAPIYGDSAETVPLRQPVRADGGGMLPTIYMADSIDYRVVVADSDNMPLREIINPRGPGESITVLGSVSALQDYGGKSDLVLVQSKDGCPAFYTRLKICGERPPENPPAIIYGHCCSVWKRCKNEADICSLETAELNCDFHVLVQECQTDANADGTKPHNDCHCADGAESADGDNAASGSAVKKANIKKASIGDLLSAAARCLPRACIPYDAPELALGTDGIMIAGDREPLDPETSAMNGSFGECLQVFLDTDLDKVAHHLQLDGGVVKDVFGVVPRAPEITIENKGSCRRQYEIRALNRLNRAVDSNPDNWQASQFGNAPKLAANVQTRLGRKGDPIIGPLLDATFGVADWQNNLHWLTQLSIADSTMGPFMSGHLGHDDSPGFVARASANSYTENDLLVILNPGEVATFVVKYHIYWDQYATPQQLKAAERIHYGTRIIARRVG